jgi:hypothetical protein
MSKAVGLTRLIHNEPVAIQGLIQATLAALVGFGVITWTPEQVGLVLALVAAVLALVTRTRVTPKSKASPGDLSGGAVDHALARGAGASVGGDVK